MKKLTCHECIHFDVCDYHITELTTMTIAECSHEFKNKDDFVEVVRCKNCIYSYGTFSEMYCKQHTVSSLDGGEDAMVDADDFCSYGEKRAECVKIL